MKCACVQIFLIVRASKLLWPVVFCCSKTEAILLVIPLKRTFLIQPGILSYRFWFFTNFFYPKMLTKVWNWVDDSNRYISYQTNKKQGYLLKLKFMRSFRHYLDPNDVLIYRIFHALMFIKYSSADRVKNLSNF